MSDRFLGELASPSHAIAATLLDASLPQFPIVWVSERFTELTGFEGPDTRGRPLSLIFGPHTEPGAMELLLRAIREGRTARSQVTCYRLDGSELPNDMLIEPISDPTGRLIFVLCLHRLDSMMSSSAFDEARSVLVATLKAHRQELQSANLLTGHVTDRILQSLFAGIIALDRKGTVIYANNAALSFCERLPHETIGHPISEVLGESFAQHAAKQSPPEEHFENVYLTARGQRREAGFSIVRVGALNDADVQCVLVFRDIGDRRQYEIELRRLKGLSALGQMAAGFAHEVRNPLAALRSLNDCLLLEIDENDSRREYSQRINALIARIESLVEHSLRYARPRPPTRAAVSPERIIHGALETLAPRISSAGHNSIDVQMPRKTLEVHVDEMQTVQVLVNLLENAMDSTGDPSRVSIIVSEAMRDSQRFVKVAVVDDGPGLDEATMRIAFDPFFTTKSKGTGLGLAIAQRLMRDNGGHLHVVSERDKRTVFSILLPCVVQDGPADAPP